MDETDQNVPVDAQAGEPLYVAVRRRLIGEISSGRFPHGASLPSELDLARQYGVHQGTVRKAIDGLVADRVLVRRQGSGTYVATPDDDAILFRFYRLKPDTGASRFPQSRIIGCETGLCDAREAKALGLAKNAPVHRFERVRLAANTPLLIETITVPAALFPGIADIDPLPNNVYRLYADIWGLSVARADERVKAIAATACDAEALEMTPGSPLLEISRVAYDLSDRSIELRVSRCRSDRFHYANTLR